MKHEASLRKILLYFGLSAQVMKFAEEAAELIAALTKHLINGDNLAKVIEECADVYVVGNQLILEKELNRELNISTNIKDLIMFCATTIKFAYKNDSDLFDMIRTTTLMAEQLMKTWGYEEQFNAKIDEKVKRTIEYIDCGKYGVL